MLLAKIVGTVVATRKDPRLVSSKLLLARAVDPQGKPEGNHLVAVDTVDAGVGETVLIVSGSSARMASGMKDCPVDAVVVGIVDHVDVAGLSPCRSDASSATSSPRARIPGWPPSRCSWCSRWPPTASRSAASWSPSTASAPASARRCSSCAARKRRFPFHPAEPPADAGIVGILDHWTLGER